MNKIPTMFERDWDGDRSLVTRDITPGCEWVLAGEGVATRKFDGTCVMFDGTSWWARREVKEGKQPPQNFRQSEHDDTTGKTIGWEPIEQSPFFKFFSLATSPADYWKTGTYELCGPKVQGDPESFGEHVLVEHASADVLDLGQRDFDSIRDFLSRIDIEGIVFHHPDGRMTKVKRKDFGMRR